jgi:hypothetical protein
MVQTGQAKIHQNLTYEQMEDITWSCQSLLRLLTYGAYREILGLIPGFNLGQNSYCTYKVYVYLNGFVDVMQSLGRALQTN